RSAPLPLKRGEERRLTLRPALPLPRRSGERWFAKRTGVGVDLIGDHPAAQMCSTSLRRHLVQETSHVGHAAAGDGHEIGAFERRFDAVGAKRPRKAQVVAEAVRLALQRKAKAGEALVDAGDELIDAGMAVALHDRIAVLDLGSKELLDHGLAPCGVGLVPG